MVKKSETLDATLPAELDALYLKFMKQFYANGNRAATRKTAASLQSLLAELPEFADSIRGEEVRSLIAELHGDYAAAIRSREAEIRKILELHTLAVNSPNWPYVSREYDFSDVSDRLDLLAGLYDHVGDTDRALATLRESQSYCEAHQITFDGGELLQELANPQDRRPVKRRNGQRRNAS